MIRFLQMPLNLYAKHVEKSLQPANYPDIQHKFAKHEAPYVTQHMRAYLASLHEDLFDGNISSKKDELLHDIASSDIADDLKTRMIARISHQTDMETMYQFLKEPFNLLFMMLRNGKLLDCAEFGDRLTDYYCMLKFCMLKFFSRKTNNPEILKIRDEISRLGIKDAILGDDLSVATSVLNGVKKVAAYGDELPRQLVVSELQEAGTLGATMRVRGGALMQISGRNFLDSLQSYCAKRHERLSQQFFIRILPEEIREKLFMIIDDKMRPASNSVEFTVLHEHGHVNSMQQVIRDEIELNPKYVEALMNLTQSRPLLVEGFAELYGKARLFGIESLTPDERFIFEELGGNCTPIIDKNISLG